MKTMLYLGVVVLLAMSLMPRELSAMPVTSPKPGDLVTRLPKTDDERIDYLIRYGHLKVGANQMNDIDSIRKSISALQRFAGIPVTGEMDEATDELMATPRCGLPDDLDSTTTTGGRRKRFIIAGSKWRRQNLTYLFQNYTSKLETDVTRKVVATALQFWSDVIPLDFSEVPSETKSADIKIRFASLKHGDSAAFDGPGGVLGHAYYPTSGATHFDEDEAWTNGVTSGVNFLQVSTHELGHALGLGHSNVSASVMAPFYRAYNPKFALTKDDIDGMQAIYGKRKTEPKLKDLPISPVEGTFSSKAPASNTSDSSTPVIRNSSISVVPATNLSTTITTKSATTTLKSTTTKTISTPTTTTTARNATTPTVKYATTPTTKTTVKNATTKNASKSSTTKNASKSSTTKKASKSSTTKKASKSSTTASTARNTASTKVTTKKAKLNSTTTSNTPSMSSTTKSTSISKTSTTSATLSTSTTRSTVVSTRNSTKPVVERTTLPLTRPSDSSIWTTPASTRTTRLPSTTKATGSAMTACSWFGRLFGWC